MTNRHVCQGQHMPQGHLSLVGHLQPCSQCEWANHTIKLLCVLLLTLCHMFYALVLGILFPLYKYISQTVQLVVTLNRCKVGPKYRNIGMTLKKIKMLVINVNRTRIYNYDVLVLPSDTVVLYESLKSGNVMLRPG